MLVDSPEPRPATASAPSAGQDSCWSLIPKPCHGKGASSGGWRAEQGCGCALGASAVPVPHVELVVDGCGVIPILLGGGHTQGTLCQEGSWVLGQICDAVGREPFPGTPGSVPWPSSALLIPIGHTTNIPRNIPAQPSLPSTFRVLLSLSPLSTFSPAPLSSSPSFPSHSRAQPSLFHIHQHHCLTFSSSTWHLLAHHPSSPSSRCSGTLGKPSPVTLCQGSRNCSELLFPGD